MTTDGSPVLAPGAEAAVPRPRQMTTDEQRLKAREHPGVRPVMYQTWRSLSFLHWKLDPAAVRKLLPEGLSVDTCEGAAYVGLIPFTMRGIRLPWLPAVPGTSAFHETNVRTYVVDKHGRPGVWFFSLEADNGLMVQIARKWYRLPYHRARMDVQSDGRASRYTSDRLGARHAPATCRVVTANYGKRFLAQPGTLEFFLAERYYLFTRSNGRLLIGQVSHVPYPLHTASCTECEETLLQCVGFDRPKELPMAHFCSGEDVEIFRLRPV